MLQDLEAAGMVVNVKKSHLEPTQQVDHLGFSIDLKQGVLQVPNEKMKSIRKELGKLLTHSSMSCRKMAAILGATRSFLMAMPFLRAFTDELVQFVTHEKKIGWDRKIEIPQELKNQVREMGAFMQMWKGRQFQGKTPVRELHSDSSQEAWAGVDVTEGRTIQEFWRDRRGLHINVKELEAAINTVKSLAKRGECVTLKVDNAVAFSYLAKGGGRIPSLNQQVRPFLRWCMEHNVHLNLQQVKSSEDLADGPSRMPKDRGDYTLNRGLFLHLMHRLRGHCLPQIDMFASPGNHQLPKFVCRDPHWQATEVNALKCPLESFHCCYANPPWKIINQWLHRLWDNKHLTCVLITPYWVSSAWWPLLLKLRVRGAPSFLIPPFWGMFKNCWGEPMPPPRWPLICTVLSGGAFRPNKSAMTLQKIIWQD
jgi:transcriptional regulator of met regulon